MTKDEFLKVLLENNIQDSEELAEKFNVEHSRVLFLFKSINDEKDKWLIGHFTYPGKIVLPRINKYYRNGIEEFLKAGGFEAQENKEKVKDEMENENYKLIMAQIKEINRNKQNNKLNMIISIGGFLTAILALLQAMGLLKL